MKIPIRRKLLISVARVIKKDIRNKVKVLVKKGDRVQPEDLVAQLKKSSTSVANISHVFKVKPSVAKKLLLKIEGDDIKRGEVLAKRKEILGFRKKGFLSPFSGRMVGFNDDTGEVLIEESVPDVDLAAGCWGKVGSVTDEIIEIEVRADEILGVVGCGDHPSEGFLKILVDRSEFLLPSRLDRNYDGKIVFNGALLTREAFFKAKTVGIKGLISGGAHFFEFETISKDLPVVLTEGFGVLPIGQVSFEILKRFENYYVMIDPKESKVSIPLPFELWEETADEGKNEAELKEGLEVRIKGESGFGLVGEVIKVGSGEEKFPSGLLSPACEVRVSEQIIKTSVCNLEAIV